MALTGIRVLEMAGLAPAPYCGMVLSNFGANVIRVDRAPTGFTVDRLASGKRSIALNLKTQKGIEIFKKMSLRSDVLIDPFRAGVMEKIGIGPDDLMSDNGSLIYARLSGFGQNGAMSKNAGHDINFLSLSGILSRLARDDGVPNPPMNLLADFAGGGLLCALGILMSLFERTKSNQGQVVDANMLEGAAYVSSWLWRAGDLGIVAGKPGTNFLDGGAPFYGTYRTKDDRFMAVGSIEPEFYERLLQGLQIDPTTLPPQMSVTDWPKLKEQFAEVFRTKTFQEWCDIFADRDACVTPVLNMDEAPDHPHIQQQGGFVTTATGQRVPIAAPRLSRTPPMTHTSLQPSVGEQTREILSEFGFSAVETEEFISSGIVDDGNSAKFKPKSNL